MVIMSGLFLREELKMVLDNIIVDGARIGFRNFSGKPDMYNKSGGVRSFCVFFDSERGADLEKLGWNIKWLKPRDEGDEPTAYLNVAVRFDNYPPKVVLVSRSGRTSLDSESIDILDSAELKTIKLAIRPYNWERDGNKGVKAYLKTGYFFLDEDEFESEFANIEDDKEDVPF